MDIYGRKGRGTSCILLRANLIVARAHVQKTKLNALRISKRVVSQKSSRVPFFFGGGAFLHYSSAAGVTFSHVFFIIISNVPFLDLPLYFYICIYIFICGYLYMRVVIEMITVKATTAAILKTALRGEQR